MPPTLLPNQVPGIYVDGQPTFVDDGEIASDGPWDASAMRKPKPEEFVRVTVADPARTLTASHRLLFHDLAHQLHVHGEFKIARSAVRLGMSMLDVQRTLHDLRAMDLATFAVDVGWVAVGSN